ncbi:hypothetical protein [Rubellicoccus peritrichatus]|uniref:Uncharacterized protein n=1 Tax=Rubellicoccus peritrichatus TaxID=3080537 RepID=A0AAQ3LCQ2_9BACT|nr:hypothetical protein [Puniceicoccus sp. CR14]WOO43634.1 hypothetical protein RZN69_11090 [Puniceicoccus sp. CR14]
MSKVFFRIVVIGFLCLSWHLRLPARVLYENDFTGESAETTGSVGVVKKLRAHQWSNQKGSWIERDGAMHYFQEYDIPGPRASWFTKSAFVGVDGLMLEAEVYSNYVGPGQNNEFEIGLVAADQADPWKLTLPLSLGVSNLHEIEPQANPDFLVVKLVDQVVPQGLYLRNGGESLELAKKPHEIGAQRLKIVIRPDEWKYWLNNDLVASGDTSTLDLSRPYRVWVYARGGGVERRVDWLRLESIESFQWLNLVPAIALLIIFGLLFTRRKPIPS